MKWTVVIVLLLFVGGCVLITGRHNSYSSDKSTTVEGTNKVTKVELDVTP